LKQRGLKLGTRIDTTASAVACSRVPSRIADREGQVKAILIVKEVMVAVGGDCSAREDGFTYGRLEDADERSRK
jgi:hypothetical protein